MIDDLLKNGLSLVVCGTAAGDRSARLGMYYAGRGNKFWRTLATVGLTPRELAPSEYRLLLDFGIGLTDLTKGQSGTDNGITFRSDGSNVLREKILEFRPRVLCFNGKRAAKELFRTPEVGFGLQPRPVGATRLFVAPSTSGAANGYWDVAWWERLAEIVRSTSP